ncbi:MAG: ABC transporter substrate-binding protein, partial [Limibacillus sp.]
MNGPRLFTLTAGLLLSLSMAGAAHAQSDANTVASSDAGAGRQVIHESHAIAMHGEPKYGPDFRHFDYVNPEAPKGGEVQLAAIGNFDSFNPFIIKGEAAAGIANTHQSLMVSSADEAFTEYCVLREKVIWPDDRSWVEFELRDDIIWHDGRPITVEDVIVSLNILKTEGHPFFRFYYGSVTEAVQTGERRVKFSFSESENREL